MSQKSSVMQLPQFVPKALTSDTYKVPRSVQFVADLPKTSTGKIMRRKLKTLDE